MTRLIYKVIIFLSLLIGSPLVAKTTATPVNTAFFVEAEEEGWVGYLKEHEGYRITLQFPKRPKITYTREGFRVEAQDQGQVHRMIIEKKEGSLSEKIQPFLTQEDLKMRAFEESYYLDHPCVDLSYLESKNLVDERIVEFSNFYLTLQTSGEIQKNPCHQRFIKSLDFYQC